MACHNILISCLSMKLCQPAFRATFTTRVEMNTNSAGVEEENLRLLPGITCLACCELFFPKAWNQIEMANLNFIWKVSVNLFHGFGNILISCLSVTNFASWPSELPSKAWIMMRVDMNTNLTSADVEYGQGDSVGMLWSFVSKSLKTNEDSQSGTSHLRSLSTDFKALETSWPCRNKYLTLPASMTFKLHIGCLPMRSAVIQLWRASAWSASRVSNHATSLQAARFFIFRQNHFFNILTILQGYIATVAYKIRKLWNFLIFDEQCVQALTRSQTWR